MDDLHLYQMLFRRGGVTQRAGGGTLPCRVRSSETNRNSFVDEVLGLPICYILALSNTL